MILLNYIKGNKAIFSLLVFLLCLSACINKSQKNQNYVQVKPNSTQSFIVDSGFFGPKITLDLPPDDFDFQFASNNGTSQYYSYSVNANRTLYYLNLYPIEKEFTPPAYITYDFPNQIYIGNLKPYMIINNLNPVDTLNILDNTKYIPITSFAYDAFAKTIKFPVYDFKHIYILAPNPL